MQLSKSDYILFLKHPAWAWLKKNDSSKLPPIDDNLQAIFDDGNKFEEYAQVRFPLGVRLGFNSFQEYGTLPKRTMDEILKGTEAIFQGRVESGKLNCIFDILEKCDDGFNLYEIKSSTKVKDEHIPDLAFQTTVLTGAGYKIKNVYVITVDKSYVRDGDVNPLKLSNNPEDVTSKVFGILDETKGNIDIALRTIESKDIPDISPRHCGLGSTSDWLDIYKSLVSTPKQSIYELCRPNAKKIGELEDMGISEIKDIPQSYLAGAQLNQFKGVLEGKRIINEKEVERFLSSFEYPLYFLDYETFSSLVPQFDGLSPYQQIPFQYSLHILDKPGWELKHMEYIHRENSLPVYPLVDSLKSHIGDSGTILVWHKSFEMKCNEVLGSICDENKEFLESLNDRIEDLKDPFSNGWFIDSNFCGSASIKKVLPALVPEFSYKNLNIQEGETAKRVWFEAIVEGKRDKEKIIKDLLEYCKLDTLAMVKIFEVLYDSR